MVVRAVVLCLLAAASLSAAEPTAAQLFAQGRKAEDAGHMVKAYLLYSEAAAKAPGNRNYWLRSQAMRTRAELEEKLLGPAAPASTGAAAGEVSGPSSPPLPPPSQADLALLRQPLPPTHLNGKPGLQNFDLRGNAQQLFPVVASAFGLECIFDNDYKAGGASTFHVDGVDYRGALHDLEAVTGSFLVPLSDTRFLVANDTPQKRTELEPEAAVEVELPEATTQADFTELVRAVQQIMAVEHVSQVAGSNSVILRDRVSKLFPARDLLESLKRPRAQIVFDIRLIEVSRNSDVTYGLTLPTQFPVLALTSWLNNVPSIPQNIVGLLAFGGGKTLLGLGIMDAASVATMSDGASRVLLDSTLRSADGLPASMHVGDKYPIITSIYSTTGTATTSSSTTTLPPAIQFEDLGLELKVTPVVHGLEDITLDVDAAYKVLSGTSVNGLPVISNRQIKSQTNLRFGDWAMVAGLLNTQEARSISGIAGLSRIPFLGPLTSTHDHSKDDDQVIILIRPQLLSIPPNAAPAYSAYTGTDARPLDPL